MSLSARFMMAVLPTMRDKSVRVLSGHFLCDALVRR